MLNAKTRDWAFDMLRRFEIPTEMFPEVVSPGTNLGTLRNDVAEFTGLGKLNVVTPATHDTGAAIAAVPTRRTGRADWAYISSGTWSLMGVGSAECHSHRKSSSAKCHKRRRGRWHLSIAEEHHGTVAGAAL